MSLSTPSNTNTALEQIFSAEDIERSLKRLTHELLEHHHGVENLVLVGIVTRGRFLAERIARLIEAFEGKTVPVGVLDITLYRDDAMGKVRTTRQSNMPCDITGKRVVLVDDVIFRGRTIRAALDALNDYGRPAVTELLVLLDRGHREVPIQPNYVGKVISTSETQRVNVTIQEVDGDEQVTLSE